MSEEQQEQNLIKQQQAQNLDTSIELYGYIINPAVSQEEAGTFTKDIPTAFLTTEERDIVKEFLEASDQFKKLGLPRSSALLSNVVKGICLTSKGHKGNQQNIIRTQYHNINQTQQEPKKKGLFGGGEKK